MITSQFMAMLRLQDELNKKVNPKWVEENYRWSRAIHAESIELMDHLGWKWWKHQKSDQAQVELELVDIWHFLMSTMICGCEGNIQHAAMLINDAWEQELPPEFVGSSALDLAEGLGVVAYMGIFSKVLLVFRSLLDACHLPDERLYTRYVAKNVLNLFRQDHGYKEGTYIKTWGDKEDNEVLAEIMAREPGYGPNDLMVALTTAYKTVV